MFCKKNLVIYFFLLLFFDSIALSNEKFAFIDVNFILEKSNSGKLVMKKLKKKNDENLKYFNLKEEKFLNKEKEIENIKNIISKEDLKLKISELKDNVNAYNLEKTKMIKNFDKFKNNELQLFFKQLNKVIENYMTENSISILFDKKNIFIGSSNHDITDDILIIFNKNEIVE